MVLAKFYNMESSSIRRLTCDVHDTRLETPSNETGPDQ